MDIATLVGIILGLGAIIGSILLMTPDMGMFVSASSFGIVFGGMLASVAVAFPLKDVLQLGAAMGAVFKGGRDTLGGLVDEAVEAAEAGRKGTADLEKHIESIGSCRLRPCPAVFLSVHFWSGLRCRRLYVTVFAHTRILYYMGSAMIFT